MIRAKNYETVSKFVKVMTKIPWPLFFRTRCIYIEIRGPIGTRQRSFERYHPWTLTTSSSPWLGVRNFHPKLQ